MKPYAIVVDAYSSGNQFAPLLVERGLEVLHVRSKEAPSPSLLATYFPEHFVQDDYLPSGNGEEAQAWIHALRQARGDPQAVVLGTETGALLCDQLAESFGLPGNPSVTAARRRNKFAMVEALHQAGIPAARQISTRDPKQARDWVRELGLEECIVKPLESAGADQVYRVRETEDLEQAFRSILDQPNQMGGENQAVLVQEYLEGPEFYANTVSCQGRHLLLEVWEYTKVKLHGRDFVYDHNDLLVDGGQSPCPEFLEYLQRVLEAIEVRIGPAHAELKWTPQGPRLVEIGPRLQGMAAFGVNRRGIGFSPIDRTVLAYLEPEKFAALSDQPYRSRLASRRVFLRSFVSGRLKGVRHEETLRGLASCEFLRWIKSPGDRLQPTVDYFSIPGIMVLAHEDPTVIERDTQTIRRLEAEGLFELEGDPSSPKPQGDPS